MPIRKMPAKRLAFVKHYLATLNASEAARKAGYAKKSAGVEGSKLLKDPRIKALVDAGLTKRDAKIEATAEYVLENLKQVVEMAMGRMQQGTYKIGRKASQPVYRFDLFAANRALELLGKHHKLFVDRVIHTGGLTLEQLITKADEPIEVPSDTVKITNVTIDQPSPSPVIDQPAIHEAAPDEHDLDAQVQEAIEGIEGDHAR